MHQVLLGHPLVDDVAHALGTRLGGKGETALLLAGNQARKLDAKGVEALGGQRDADAGSRQVGVQPPQDRLEVRVVRRRKRGERHLVVAGLAQPAHDGGDDLVGRALAHGPIGHPRLAEPASARAAAQDLNREAVMDHLGIGHQGRGHRVGGLKVRHDALDHPGGRLGALLGTQVAAT